MFTHPARNFAVVCSNGNHRSSNSGNPVKLAGNNQPLEFGSERHEVHICCTEGKFQKVLRLVGNKTEEFAEAAFLHRASKTIKLVAATGEQKQDAVVIAQQLRGREHGLKLMGTTKISRIAHHELIL